MEGVRWKELQNKKRERETVVGGRRHKDEENEEVRPEGRVQESQRWAQRKFSIRNASETANEPKAKGYIAVWKEMA